MSTFLYHGLGFAAYMLQQAAQDALLRNEIGSAEDSTIGRPIGISTCKISSTLSFVVWAGSIARATYDSLRPTTIDGQFTSREVIATEATMGRQATTIIVARWRVALGHPKHAHQQFSLVRWLAASTSFSRRKGQLHPYLRS